MTATVITPPQLNAAIEKPKPTSDGTAPAAAKPKISFPHLGSGFIGYSAIASFISWQQSYTYYNELGAPWFLNAFSTTRLIMESALLLTALLVFGVAAMAIVRERQPQARRVVDLSIGFGIAGLVVTLGGYVGSDFLTPVVVFRLAQVAIVLFGVATAFVVAGVVTGAMENGPPPAKLRLWAMWLVVALGVWRAPALSGRARAARDAHPRLSTLPQAVGPAPADTGWRLVSILDRKFLLMKPAARREDRLFRVTENFDGWRAGPSH
jgi:hypothetical protein